MKPYVVYLRGGIGDQYAFFAMLPEFLKERNITTNDLEIYVDSVYFYSPQQYWRQKEALLAIYTYYDTLYFTEIPGNVGSAHNLHFFQEERERGFNLDLHGTDFMYARTQTTKDYFKNILQGRPLIDVPYVEQVLEFKNGQYTKLNYKRKQILENLHIETHHDLLNNLFGSYNEFANNSILCFINCKGRQENFQKYLSIIKSLNSKKIRTIVIGTTKEVLPSETIDLRNRLTFQENLFLINYAPITLMSGSSFAFHRLHNNNHGFSVYNWPCHLGDPFYLLPQDQTKNPYNYFFNADKDNTKEIINTLIKGLDNVS
jgi:hypothetical protein